MSHKGTYIQNGVSKRLSQTIIQEIFHSGRDTTGEAEQGECPCSTGASYASRCYECVTSRQRRAHASAYCSSSCSANCPTNYCTCTYSYSCPGASPYSCSPVINPRSASAIPSPTCGRFLPGTNCSVSTYACSEHQESSAEEES